MLKQEHENKQQLGRLEKLLHSVHIACRWVRQRLHELGEDEEKQPKCIGKSETTRAKHQADRLNVNRKIDALCVQSGSSVGNITIKKNNSNNNNNKENEMFAMHKLKIECIKILRQLRNVYSRILKVFGEPEENTKLQGLLISSLEKQLQKITTTFSTKLGSFDVTTAAKIHNEERQAQLITETKSVLGNVETFILPYQAQEGSSNYVATLAHAQMRQRALVAGIEFLRNLETTVMFHHTLWDAQQSAVADGVYSNDNFTYGTTPFSSWLAVFSTPAVKAAVARCRKIGEPLRMSPLSRMGPDTYHCTVFGSSTGLLALYTVLCKCLFTEAWEILPNLVKAARTCINHISSIFDQDISSYRNVHRTTSPVYKDNAGKDEHSVHFFKSEFMVHDFKNSLVLHCDDMLNANITNTALLLLTSQCWDEDLITKTYCKILLEAPSQCIIVDYMDRRAYVQDKDYTISSHVEKICSSNLILRHVVEVSVSWNAHQKLFVLQKL